MMKRIITYILLPVLLIGCSDHEEPTLPPEEPTGTAQISFSLQVEDMHTRSGVDISNKINNIEVLAFEEIQGSFSYTYRSTAQKTDQSNEYSVALRPTNAKVILLPIANYSNFQQLQTGFSIEKAMEVLHQPFTADGINQIPMYSEIAVDKIDAQTIIDDVILLRSVAAVEVILGDELYAGNNFSLQTVQAYRANNLIQIIPDPSGVDKTEWKVSHPSIPQIASNTITTSRVDAEGVSDEESVRIYLPESAAPAPENVTKDATCLIIGGIYKENEQDTNTTVTYYRVDLGKAAENNLGQILRNYRYTVKITEVAGPGTSHPDEAVDANISAIIYEWGESNHNIEL